MLLVIPVLTAITFLVSWWVTETFVEQGSGRRPTSVALIRGRSWLTVACSGDKRVPCSASTVPLWTPTDGPLVATPRNFATPIASLGSARGQKLSDLNGVQGRALAQVVVADEQRQAAVVGDARVVAEPADVRRVLAGRLERASGCR